MHRVLAMWSSSSEVVGLSAMCESGRCAQDGRTALAVAAQQGHTATVVSLVESKAHVDLRAEEASRVSQVCAGVSLCARACVRMRGHAYTRCRRRTRHGQGDNTALGMARRAGHALVEAALLAPARRTVTELAAVSHAALEVAMRARAPRGRANA